MANFSVIYDANIFYSAPLRDLLVELACTSLFKAKWTEEIHSEWIESLLKDRTDIKRQSLETTKNLINEAVPDCLIENYESLITAVTLPDANDRHVLAAAIKGKADLIVTLNLKDFPTTELNKYSIKAKHPDDFLMDLLSLSAPTVHQAIRDVRSRLKNPPIDSSRYLDNLEARGLPITVSSLRAIASTL